jgi:hypothetical protein
MKVSGLKSRRLDRVVGVDYNPPAKTWQTTERRWQL